MINEIIEWMVVTVFALTIVTFLVFLAVIIKEEFFS